MPLHLLPSLLLYILMVGYTPGPANLVWLLAGAWLRKWFVSYKKQTDVIMATLLALCAIAIIL